MIQGLQAMSWRGIVFPYAALSTTTEKGVVEHRKPDVDGSPLEDLGRASRVISCVALFRNKGTYFDRQSRTLYPNGTGGEQPQFPDVFLAFLAACDDRSTGELVHPYRGTIQAKVISVGESLQATVSDGADVSVTWKEHVEDDSALGTESPLATAQSTSEAADVSLAAATAKAIADHKSVYTPKKSFADMVRSIQAAADTVALVARRGASSIDSILAEIQRTKASLDRLLDVTTNRAASDLERLEAALRDAKKTVAVDKGRDIRFYVVPGDQTLGALATKLRSTTTDLIRLNPSVAANPIVQARTVLRYYAPA